MKHCNNCGKTIKDEAKFCVYCGKKIIFLSSKTKTKNQSNGSKKKNKSYLEIEIPRISGNKIIKFNDDCVSYKDTTIKYEEMTGISCKQIAHSTNLIPTHQEFNFSFYDTDSSISIDFGTTLHIGSKEKKEIFNKLYLISKNFLTPIIVEKMIDQIFKEDETIQIGYIYFNKNGYYKKKFLGGEDWVYWTDSIGEPGMESGSILLYKADGDKYRIFDRVELKVRNAILIPDLMVAIYSIIKSKDSKKQSKVKTVSANLSDDYFNNFWEEYLVWFKKNKKLSLFVPLALAFAFGSPGGIMGILIAFIICSLFMYSLRKRK